MSKVILRVNESAGEISIFVNGQFSSKYSMPIKTEDNDIRNLIRSILKPLGKDLFVVCEASDYKIYEVKS